MLFWENKNINEKKAIEVLTTYLKVHVSAGIKKQQMESIHTHASIQTEEDMIISTMKECKWIKRKAKYVQHLLN